MKELEQGSEGFYLVPTLSTSLSLSSGKIAITQAAERNSSELKSQVIGFSIFSQRGGRKWIDGADGDGGWGAPSGSVSARSRRDVAEDPSRVGMCRAA